MATPVVAALSCILAAVDKGLAPNVGTRGLLAMAAASALAPELVLAVAWLSILKGNSPGQETNYIQRHFMELLPTIGWLSLEYAAPLDIVLNEEDTPHQEDRRLYEKALDLSYIGRTRNYLLTAIVVLTLASLFYSPSAGVLGAVVILTVSFLPRGDLRGRTLDDSAPVGEAEGIYRVFEHIGPWAFMKGVATVTGGSIVSSLHVTGDRAVWIEDRRYEPSVVQPSGDFIAWGRPPVIKPLKEDDEVVALALHPATDTVLPLRSRTARVQGNAIYRISRTSPGVSGSPLFVVDFDENGDRTFALAGTIGRSIRAGPYHQYEIQSHLPLPTTPYDTILRAGIVLQLFSHPGAGKTRAIPEYVRQLMTWSNKVYVAGPTRVVAREMLEALEGTRWVCAMVKGLPKPHALARVVVTTHQTLLRYALTSGLLASRDVSYVLDETHVDSAQTKVLRALVHQAVGKDKSKAACIEMTATGRDSTSGEIRVATDSNYHIEEHVYNTNVVQAVKQYADTYGPRRVAVFVPGLTGKNGALQVAKQVRQLTDYATVVLSRKTYEKNIKLIFKDYPRGLCIVTTSISECGANYDLDAVFDTCQQYHYLVTASGTKGMITPSTQAQTCQRRGRVGRRKEGQYYRPANYDLLQAPPLDHPDSVTLLEANMCLRALGLPEEPCGRVVEEAMLKMQPSKDQVYRWLTEGDTETLTETMAMYNVEGGRRSREQERTVRNRMRTYFHDVRWERMEDQEETPQPRPGEYIWDEEGPEIIQGALYTRAPPPHRIRVNEATYLRGTVIETLREEADRELRETVAEQREE
uniref:Genome polyprotein n=1 Tax=Jingmen tick virus TaxID=1172985 RepID=A0A3G4YIU6_9FLAV|nr:NS3-like protein [Jingmen tick virus]